MTFPPTVVFFSTLPCGDAQQQPPAWFSSGKTWFSFSKCRLVLSRKAKRINEDANNLHSTCALRSPQSLLGGQKSLFALQVKLQNRNFIAWVCVLGCLCDSPIIFSVFCWKNPKDLFFRHASRTLLSTKYSFFPPGPRLWITECLSCTPGWSLQALFSPLPGPQGGCSAPGPGYSTVAKHWGRDLEASIAGPDFKLHYLTLMLFPFNPCTASRSPPTNLFIDSESPTSLQIHWKPPEGRIQHYRITYSPVSDPSTQQTVSSAPWQVGQRGSFMANRVLFTPIGFSLSRISLLANETKFLPSACCQVALWRRLPSDSGFLLIHLLVSIKAANNTAFSSPWNRVGNSKRQSGRG